ncbi:ribbon-helix-helix domain-containing protein [Aureimonas pseudogalii]|uniref:Putative DNA-binding ribbon-helix-helix protein/catechol 2,3-dioxygenase-like lactoylglutathione lyase family enzyme n=1 Tax=Aureimonas pseudogalii TaxID=1744844 RepID=A0A7W6H455_9HYPH|nr:ribbon-helix-helix domain-containing protein [Aureimonas pseudogalii]MBB3998480.1 putative DNA-binding ribbon-helix-helix protein/catechol 2,3-dioxygenase-like lactoylglutathione lyase family enzyme [Aureimonas pseudogalii]
MTVKRSLSIQGHRTSISIEDAFWQGLRDIATRTRQPLAALVAEIDAGRAPGTNLSSAIRLRVLADLQDQPRAPSPLAPDTTPFSHVYLGVSDHEAARAFWAPLAALLGWRARFHDLVAGWSGWQPSGADRPLFLIGRPFDGQNATVGNGAMVAFLAADRETVDQCHALALRAGGADEGPPGLRPHYHPHYYGAYFRDLDGNKICVCHHGGPSETNADPD